MRTTSSQQGLVEVLEVLFVRHLELVSSSIKQHMVSFQIIKTHCKLSDLPNVTCLASVRVKGALIPVLFPLFLSGCDSVKSFRDSPSSLQPKPELCYKKQNQMLTLITIHEVLCFYSLKP